MAKTSEVMEIEKQEVSPAEGAERLSNRRTFVPRCDIYEMEDKVFVVADMPGVDSESVDIQVEKNILTINGWVSPEEDDSHSLAYSEYEVGDYQRRFTLSNEINISGIEAKVKDGVLHLDLPKIIPSSKKVLVKAG